MIFARDLHETLPGPRVIDDHSPFAGRRSTCGGGGEVHLQEVAPRQAPLRLHGVHQDLPVEADEVLAPGGG